MFVLPPVAPGVMRVKPFQGLVFVLVAIPQVAPGVKRVKPFQGFFRLVFLSTVLPGVNWVKLNQDRICLCFAFRPAEGPQ